MESITDNKDKGAEHNHLDDQQNSEKWERKQMNTLKHEQERKEN